MKPIALLLVALLPFPLVAAERADLTLKDGRVLKAARIIAIGEKTATVSHNGKVENLAIDDLPLDALGRAYLEIEAKTKDNAAVAARADAQSKTTDEKKAEELQIRLAAANVRAAAQGGEQVAIPATKAKPNPETQLIALKAQFPVRKRRSVGTGSDRIEIETPSIDIWNYYKGMVQTTTIQALPITMKRIEERIASDLIDLSKPLSLKDRAARAQASASKEWLNRELRAFLNQLSALNSGK